MATTRPFAYNTGSTIDGTTQIGNIAIGVSDQDYSQNPGGVKWWMGPDEDLGYVIAHEVPTGDQPTPVEVDASIAFWRSTSLTDQSFLDLLNILPITIGLSLFTNVSDALTWLTNNNYFTSYTSFGSSGFQWMTVTSVTDSTASGIGQNGITAAITQSGGGMVITQGVFNPTAFPEQYGVPFTGNQIANYNSGTFTAIFSQPVTDALVAFASIGNSGLYVPIEVSAPFTPIFGLDVSYQNAVNGTQYTQLTGNEGYSIIRIDGTVTGVTFNYTTPEGYCNICFGFVDQNNLPSTTPTPTPTAGAPTSTPTPTPTALPATSTPTPVPTDTPTPTPTSTGDLGDNLLQENGDSLLQENDDNILLESTSTTPTPTPTGAPTNTPTPTPAPTDTPTPTPTPIPTYYYYYLLNCNLGDNKYGRSLDPDINLSGFTFNVDTNICYIIAGNDNGPYYDYDLDVATIVTDCTDVLCGLPTPTPTPTATSSPTSTPTATPEMASLDIDIVMGYNGISFGGVTYTSDTTINVIKNQQYNIIAFNGSGLFQNWEGTNVNLPVPNSSNTIVTITGDTATLKAVFPEMTPTPTPTTAPTSTPLPATSTPTPTPTTVGSCSGVPYNLTNIFGPPTSGNAMWISNATPPNVSNLVNTLAIANPAYFNKIDNDGTDRTSYFNNFTGSTFTMTVCQNGNSATYTGISGAIAYDNGTNSFIIDGVKLSLVQSSPVSAFTFNELVYIDLSNGSQPTATPVPTGVPTDTPTPAPTDTPTSVPTDTPIPATSTPVPTDTPTPTPTPTPTAGATGLLTISEVGSDVVMSVSGTIDLTGLTLVASNVGPSGGGGLGTNTATFLSGPTGLFYNQYSGFTITPSNFGTGGGLSRDLSSGDMFGVIGDSATPPPYFLVVPTGYTSGTQITSTQTFTGQTFTTLGLTVGTYTYTWSGGSFDVVIGNGVGGPTPTPTLTSTPAPTATPTPEPTATPTSTPTLEPTSTPTPLPATSTPTPSATPTDTPTPSPTPIPEFWIVNSNSTRTVTAIKYGAISAPLSLDGGSLPLGVGEVYKANHNISIDGNGMNTLELDFGGTGFWATFTILKNDVDAYGSALNGYAAGAVTLGGLSISPTDKIKIILT